MFMDPPSSLRFLALAIPCRVKGRRWQMTVIFSKYLNPSTKIINFGEYIYVRGPLENRNKIS